MKHVFLLLLLCSSFIAIAQNSYKHEKEARIEKKDFPREALDLLDKTLPKKIKKVTYYKEQDSTKISYEIKLKYNGKKYSIEFNEEGILEDIEITIKSKDIIPKTFENIQKYLNTKYASFRIKKIQRQYRNTTNSDPETVVKEAFSGTKTHTHSYEIIAEVKTGKKRYFIEITFTEEGNFELSRTIIRSSYDHILY